MIEHQVHCVDCPCCGQRNRGELPADVAASWFGPNVISLVGLLMGRYRLSKRQVTHLLAECFGITMTASTVVNQQQVISQALAAPVAEVEPTVKNEPVCNIDETSWRQVGACKRPWLWTVVTAQITLFRMAPSRSSQVARELLGETCNGVAGTDRCSSYTWLEQRQLCWSHLVRDFQKILERGGDSYPVGWYLRVQADYLLMKWARVRDGTLDYFEFLTEFPAIQTQIRHWLTVGLQVPSSRTTETCRRLLAADPDLWRFVSVPGLEPTNNSAERALRHPVIWRRSPHGTQSDLGSRFVERILTVVETCRQQQRPVFDFLRDALIAYQTGQAAPSLLPCAGRFAHPFGNRRHWTRLGRFASPVAFSHNPLHYGRERKRSCG